MLAVAQADREDSLAALRRAQASWSAIKRTGEATQTGRMSDYLREEVKGHRERLGLRQEDLARRMREAGCLWQRVTVAEVERGSRRVSLDELVILAAIFSVPVVDLLVPPTARNVLLETSDGEHTTVPATDVREMFGGGSHVAEGWSVPEGVVWATGKLGEDDEEPHIDPGEVD